MRACGYPFCRLRLKRYLNDLHLFFFDFCGLFGFLGVCCVFGVDGLSIVYIVNVVLAFVKIVGGGSGNVCVCFGEELEVVVSGAYFVF